MEKVILLFGKAEINYFLEHGKLNDEIEKNNLRIFEFNSEVEKIAFLKGINEAIGWQDVYEVENLHQHPIYP